MPTKSPRINAVLEKPLYQSIERLATRDGVSLSLKVRDLVREALEIEGDIALAGIARGRERTLPKAQALRHDEVWQRWPSRPGSHGTSSVWRAAPRDASRLLEAARRDSDTTATRLLPLTDHRPEHILVV